MPSPPRDEILPTLRRRLHAALRLPAVRPPNGERQFYLPVQLLVPGQEWISVDNIIGKIRQAHVDPRFLKNLKGGIDLAFADGTSTEPFLDPPKIKVASSEAGYVIIDGHHETCRAIILGSSSVPVEVIEDYTLRRPVMSMLDVWRDLKARDLSLFSEAKTPEHLAEYPPCLCDLTDKPNRYLARLLGAKVLMDAKGEITLAESRGVKYPIWMKINQGIPFMEFYIADILERAGIRYDLRWANDVPDEIVERARQLLLEAREQVLLRHIFKRIYVLRSKEEAGDFLERKNWNSLRKLIPPACSTAEKSES